ncbi:MAG: ectonucleotide pyrophosphatase/phosphodiesterase [Colwellia sp.]
MSRFLVCLLILIMTSTAHSKPVKSTVILLSIDGFAYDYLTKFKPKHILNFGKSGVKAKLLSVYPSKTFPNHLSIITGVYPAKHGIIHNRFYHPGLKEKYSLGAGKNNSLWLTAKPFWSFAEENNILSAVYFWPESEAIGKNKQASFNIAYNRTDSEKARFDQIINWLKLPTSQAPHFIASYFSSVDAMGHKFGPNSVELKNAVADIDKLFGYFISRLKKEITFDVNIILVSDHGMMQINESSKVDLAKVFNEQLTQWISDNSIVVAQSSTQLFLYLDDSKLSKDQKNSIFKSLIKQKKENQSLYSVYRKNQYPEHWQLNKDLAIIPDIIIEIAPNGYFNNTKTSITSAATHGYDVINQPALTAIFLASGPDIIKGRKLNAFENIHIVPLMSQLLGLPQRQDIDGKRSVLQPIIKTNCITSK